LEKPCPVDGSFGPEIRVLSALDSEESPKVLNSGLIDQEFYPNGGSSKKAGLSL
jgi:hypothetical protein